MDVNSKALDMIPILISQMWVFGTLYVFSELGERVTIGFERFHEELLRCNWYELPIEMQRMYLIFLADTQQPKHVTCYANVIFRRETFEKVLFVKRLLL